jgi:hypothetical protein
MPTVGGFIDGLSSGVAASPAHMNEYEAEQAYDLDPWHPLIHLAVAGIEEDTIRADF